MTDEELANAIVAAGVGSTYGNTGWFWINGMESRLDTEMFVRDWRVAGAMMEKVGWSKLYHIIGIQHLAKRVCPRDINKACVKALSSET